MGRPESFMNKILFLTALAAFTVHAHEVGTLETVYFRADMTTANETPAVTGVTASARAIIAAHIRRDEAGVITSAVVDFDVDYNFDGDGTFTGLHIHDGAAGVNGPVTINSSLAAADGIAAQGAGNIFRGAPATSAAALATLKSMLADPSKHYVNLHTTSHAGGVVRAQLSRAEMRVSRVTLDPANEVPAVASDGKGSGSLIFLATRDTNGNINAGTVSFETTYRFGSPVTFTGWHIHSGGPTVAGPVVINTSLASTNADVQNVTAGVVRRRVDVTSGAALTALQGIYADPTNYYLNIHTTTNPGGVMRGQLEPSVQNAFQISMETDQEVPFVVDLTAEATAKVTVFSSRNAAGALASATVVFDVNYEFPGSTTFTGLQIHAGDLGVVGPVVVDSGIGAAATVTDSDGDGNGNLYRVVDVSALTSTVLAAVQAMMANPVVHYLNLHTTANPGGAVRGPMGPVPATALINRGAILNNASYNLAGTSVAPGSIAAVFGTGLTNGAQCLSTEGCSPRYFGGNMGTSMGGTSVTVNGIPAPIFYATPTQLGIQMPVELAGSSATVVVNADGQTSVPETVALESAAPGIFSTTGDGRGVGSITHANGALVTAANPAVRGETLVLYATGLGSLTPSVATGNIATSASQLATTSIACNCALWAFCARKNCSQPTRCENRYKKVVVTMIDSRIGTYQLGRLAISANALPGEKNTPAKRPISLMGATSRGASKSENSGVGIIALGCTRTIQARFRICECSPASEGEGGLVQNLVGRPAIVLAKADSGGGIFGEVSAIDTEQGQRFFEALMLHHNARLGLEDLDVGILVGQFAGLLDLDVEVAVQLNVGVGKLVVAHTDVVTEVQGTASGSEPP